MDNMKNGVHADTAEAENTETMDLLAGMLDASTHCGDNDEDDKEPAQAGEETPGGETPPNGLKKLPAKNPRPENNNRREKTDSSIQRAKCADSPHTYRIQHTGQKQDEGGFRRIIQQT